MGLFLVLIPGLIFWIYSMYDAYITAGKMNAGTLEFRPVKLIHMVLFIAAAVFMVIAIVVAVMMISFQVCSLNWVLLGTRIFSRCSELAISFNMPV